jgi:hypothetical protein
MEVIRFQRKGHYQIRVGVTMGIANLDNGLRWESVGVMVRMGNGQIHISGRGLGVKERIGAGDKGVQNCRVRVRPRIMVMIIDTRSHVWADEDKEHWRQQLAELSLSDYDGGNK